MKYLTKLLLLAVICTCCEKRSGFTKENVHFDFSGNLLPRSQQRIADEILFQIEHLKRKTTNELSQIHRLKIDSIPFAYVFYIPFQDSIWDGTKETFDLFAITLSENSFNNTPVNIVLTDVEFSPLKQFPFHEAKIKVNGNWIRTSKTFIEADSNIPQIQLGGVEVILLSELSELYKTEDRVHVELKQGHEGINIDITYDESNINVDTLKSQLTKMDLLPWFAIFDGRPFRFLVKTNSNKIIYKSS